ncbi:MAG: GNAT family N-acetyltransferase [Acidobacteriota bacterium]
MTGAFRIRGGTPQDEAWLLPLSARLHDFGPPRWRDRPEMDAAVARAIGEALKAGSADAPVFVAEDPDGRPLGFVHMHELTDYFTGETHGHVSDIVVASDGEGRGVGRALMAAGEKWSRERGHRLLSLNVFGDNARARRLYDRLGFELDTSRLIKVLRS